MTQGAEPTILVVDDQIAVVEFLEALLAEEGYRVITCEHGKEALALLAARHADLVLTDVQMPYMDGWELLKAIRARPEWRSLPVIMMSATIRLPFNPDELDPATLYISKPFSVTALLDQVDRLLSAS